MMLSSLKYREEKVTETKNNLLDDWLVDIIIKLLTWVQHGFYKRIYLCYIETLLSYAYITYFISIVNIASTYHACLLSIVSMIENMNWVILSISVKFYA